MTIDTTTDGAARAEAKLVWIMPKYRANESRVKLAWLCRVQPIFNEVNRDRGRRSQPDGAARAESSSLELCRVVTEEDLRSNICFT